MNAKSLFVIGSMALMGAAFTSCSKEIAFDNEAVVKQQIAEYQANFIKKYGAIDPNQTWDFSTMQTTTSLPESYVSATRAAEAVVTRSDQTMLIDNGILSWTEENLKPGVNNTVKGNPFKHVVPDNSFTIVPIFQGCASYFWELWMHVDGLQDVRIWKKGQKLQFNTSEGGTFKNTGTGKNDGTAGAYEVLAPAYTFAGLPVGNDMWFYLKVWKKGASSYENGDEADVEMSSLEGWMLSMKVPTAKLPVNIPEGNTATIIGCEDNEKASSTDRDFEDLVFLMYGKPTPPTIPVGRILHKQTKRYLIEDLGSKDDFDFNDVVVDMSDVWQDSIVYTQLENGSWIDSKRRITLENTRHQEAIIRAMGGTINFQLKIGEKAIWEKKGNYNIENMLNTGWGNTAIDPDAKYAVIRNCVLDDKGTVKSEAAWTWKDNNISIIVEGRGANEGIITTIGFPKKGEAPMIIATNASPLEKWQPERVSIPNWWYTE